MLAAPPRIWPAPPPAHVNGAAAATRYGYSSLAQILPSPQDKGEEQQQQAGGGVFPEEPIKLRKETKQANNNTDWRRKDRGRIKIEPGVTPCQVPEVTTSSKHEQNGGNTIPVGIAVARQRLPQSTPPPLTVLTCEERSTNQVTGWTGPPPHWQYPGVDQGLPVQVPPLQFGRDPISGQILLLPSGNLGDSMQRTVLWPGGNATSGSNQPPPLVMPGAQPVLLSDRYVTLAPPPSAVPSSGHHHHHHQDKRRHDHSTSTIHGGSSGGLAVGLFPPPPPPQAPFLMMPFSHQNNSLLLSTHLEHNLNTMVVTNHQLSESAVLNPMEVITSPVDGFGGGGMIQQLPPSVVISHTETNSFVRSDINAVYPTHPHVQTHASHLPQPPPSVQHQQIVVKEEVEQIDETMEEEAVEDEMKAEVMDASNQTESPVEDESEAEDEVVVKVEDKACATIEEESQAPDMSGLELLLTSIAQYEKRSSTTEETFRPPSPEEVQKSEDKVEEDEWEDGNIQDGMKCGLGLLCTVAERCLEEEVVDEKIHEAEAPLSPTINSFNEYSDKRDEELSENDRLSDDCEMEEEKEIRVSVGSDKKGEWYTLAERGRDRLKLKIKRRPGRPKKKTKIRKRRSPSQREPPVLQPWSASPSEASSPLTSPPTLTPHKRKLSHEQSQESDEEGSSSSGGHPPPLSPACSSPKSSKKRKVGRPKKREETPPKTELIVTKSVPSNKAIGRILANNSSSSNQASESSSAPLTTTSSMGGSQNKIKPKLKAEAKVKEWHDDEELDLSPGKENGLDDPLPSQSPVWKSPSKAKVVSLSPPRKPKVNIVKKLRKEEEKAAKLPHYTIEKSADFPVAKLTTHVIKSPSSANKSPHQPVVKASPARIAKSPHHRQSHSSPSSPSPKQEKSSPVIPDCKLTEAQLKSLPCRILSMTNGQFYPGEITKIIAPDIYEVHIYKERSRKPQILCREEILCSSVAEIHCPEDMVIPSGTRVCAYWSQQYSCFYPGRVICDSAAGQVPIDFDDGDNGTIERTSVRFLPQDYPVVEPTNLLGKRKRYNSTTSSDSQKNNDSNETNVEPDNSFSTLSVTDDKLEKKTMEDTKNAKKEDNPQDEVEKNSVIDGDGADEIMSVLQSEKEEALEIKRKNKYGDKTHKHHKHHKHRGGCKTHKCKHKHLWTRKHKHSLDVSKRKAVDSDRSDGTPCPNKENEEMQTDEEGEDCPEEKATASLPKGLNSKIAPLLPVPWTWGKRSSKRRQISKPKGGKGFRISYNSIQRRDEVINVGEDVVFISTGRPDRPFIGRVDSFWQNPMKKNMIVKVAWFYHPEEAIGCPDNLPYPGGLFISSHFDINDVQTISHRCEVLPYTQFHEKAENEPNFANKVYENNETYYLAGQYNPFKAKLDLQPEVAAICAVPKFDTSPESSEKEEN